MSHPDKPTAGERPPATLPGRDSAPTGVPADAKASVGGEGTPAARVQARDVGAPIPSAGAEVLLQLVTGLLPALIVRLVPLPGTSWFSVDLNTEGLFLFVRPVEVALVFPWVKL